MRFARKLSVLFLLALFFISACEKPENEIKPSGKLADVKMGRDFKASLYLNPDPDKREIKSSDGLWVSVYLENNGNDDINGVTIFEDTPDDQYGGVTGLEYIDFRVEGMKSGIKDAAIINPGQVFYESGLDRTEFFTDVRYFRNVDFLSDAFILKDLYFENVKDCKRNCGNRNILRSDSNLLSSIEEELFDNDGDMVVDSITAKFELSERDCDIIGYGDVYNLEVNSTVEVDVYLKESGNAFQCSIENGKDKKRKTIICAIDNILGVNEPIEERIIGNLRYGCSMKLKSGTIMFKKEESV